MDSRHPPEEAAWVHGHAHDPNLLPPEGDGHFVVRIPSGLEIPFTTAALAQLPYTEVAGCLIVSTGHGTSGPFTFGGVLLTDLLSHVLGQAVGQAAGQAEGLTALRQVDAATPLNLPDVISADGFGTRLLPVHLASGEPILLAYRRDGQLLTRAQGLVRLVVPAERDDALRQVKWVARIEIG